MEPLNVWIMDDIHRHYHLVQTQDHGRICIDVIHFGGQVHSASWYGVGPASMGSVYFKNKSGGSR